MPPNDLTDDQRLTPDPMGGDLTNPQSLNRYAYVGNNPMSMTDQSGLGPCDNLQYGQGKGQCQTDVNGVIAANTELGPSSWDPFELIGIPVVTNTYSPPNLLSTIDWSSMANANGYATTGIAGGILGACR
ncbi:MAG: hypothetical protein ACREP9_18185 [Candidatus Dormibacteraceae bacterium]